MLFNSVAFVFIFLPAALVSYFMLGRYSGSVARIGLSVLSFIFYSYWDYQYLPLLVFSIAVNFVFGLKLSRETAPAKRMVLLKFGLVFNLLLLFFFKYAAWMYSLFRPMLNSSLPDEIHIALPIGVSFFTFTQIAFLIDCYRVGVKEYRFWDYALFVSYFPHQIAGPILHHKEMMDQFKSQIRPKFDENLLLVGVSVFTIGLAKKVFFADTFDTYASPVFANADAGAAVSFFEAWGASLAYTLQLYFDFSAYSDMAIGISLMFGIRLPLNFYSPYKSTSIIDFWRRWHMTLSRFLRDYLYIPLGGSHRGVRRRYVNLMITMVLGGLWHGASLTFVFWGALHGLYLCINHLWRGLVESSKISGLSGYRFSGIRSVIGWAITFVAVVVAWVFFRAETFSGATSIIVAMFMPDAVYFPMQLREVLPDSFSVSTDWAGATGGIQSFLVIFFGLAVCLFMPNPGQIFTRYAISLDKNLCKEGSRVLSFSLTGKCGLVYGALLGVLLTRLGGESVFLYFNF